MSEGSEMHVRDERRALVDRADGQHRGVVALRARAADGREHVVEQLLHVLRPVGHGALEPIEPGAEPLVAALDEAVGVEEQQRPGLELHLLLTRGREAHRKRHAAGAGEVPHRAVRRADDRRRVAGARVLQGAGRRVVHVFPVLRPLDELVVDVSTAELLRRLCDRVIVVGVFERL